MPYQYVTAKVRRRGIEAVWETVDLSTLDCNHIFQTYALGSIELAHSSISQPRWISLAALAEVMPPYIGQRTLAQFLISLGEGSLPTTIAPPNFRYYHAKFADVWEAGYSVKPFDRTRHPDLDLPAGEANDLLLSKPGVDFLTHWSSCMVTVNGLYHRVAGSPYGLMVVDGGRTGRISNHHQLGMLSFREVGALDYIPISPEMLYKSHESQQFRQFVNIKVPKNLTGKTVMLVIGGYLHVLDNTYKVVGDNTVRVFFKNMALPERYYDTWQHLNMAPLDLDQIEGDERRVAVDELYSDQAIRGYLTLPQSFLVLIDTEQLYIQKHLAENTGIPGRYIINQAAYKQLPLVGAYGRVYEYVAKNEYGRTMMCTQPNVRNNYNFRTTSWTDKQVLNDNTYSAKPWERHSAHLLEIGRISY